MQRRFVDFQRSEREIPFGSMNQFPEETLTDRQHFRRGPEISDEAAVDDLIGLVLAQVQDVRVPGGCITSKVRPDRLWVELALRRIVQRRPPRRLAADFGCSNRYARFGVERGRALLKAIGFDSIAETLVRSQEPY